MRRLAVIGWVGVLLAAATARAADESYAIRFQRPLKAGESFAFSATNTVRASEKVDFPNGMGQRTSSFRRVIVEADVHIDKVDDAGNEAASSVVIRKLTLQSSEADQAGQPTSPRVMLEPGTEVVLFVQANGQPAFALKKNGPLSDEATLALQEGFMRMTLSDAGYGTTEKKKVGDTWPLDTRALAGDKMSPQYVDPSFITGTATLKSLRTVSGIPCLQLDSSQTVKNFSVQGATPKEATKTTQVSATVPVNIEKPTVAWSVHTMTHFITEEKPLGQGILRRAVDSEIEHEATLLPK